MDKIKIELDEKDLRKIKRTARREAMKREKFSTSTKPHDNKAQYKRKRKHQKWDDED